jgi:hypothetical protein
LTFESGSRLSQIDFGVFCRCSALQSIVIPKMVRVLEIWCFVECSSLGSVIFESNSTLEMIDTEAFAGCTALKSICLPASLSAIDGSAFVASSIEDITVDPENAHCFVSGRYLVSVDGIRLI